MHVVLTSGRATTRCTTFCGKRRCQSGPWGVGGGDLSHTPVHLRSLGQDDGVGERVGGTAHVTWGFSLPICKMGF